MTKAVLFVDPEGVASAPAILCAESAEEAEAKALPLFSTVFEQITAGMQITPIGNDFNLFENGKRIGTLEVFTSRLSDE